MGAFQLAFQAERNVHVVPEAQSSQVFFEVFRPGSRDSAVIIGDSHRVLEQMPTGAFQACVTSPPYWSLRNYHIEGQIGLELSLDDYIANLVSVFDQVRRLLRDDGTLWLNIGDSFTSGGRTWRAPDKKNPVRAMNIRPPTPAGLKPKDLIGVPWRLAFALQNAGWYLRADIIWNKPNCQPESVKDRPTRSHEYVFLFSKSEQYVYHDDAVRGPNGRHMRTVWDVRRPTKRRISQPSRRRSSSLAWPWGATSAIWSSIHSSAPGRPARSRCAWIVVSLASSSIRSTRKSPASG